MAGPDPPVWGGEAEGVQARAGWAGATSHDSDKAPDTLGPRKDAALAD